jgi:hypothetical protein
MAVRTAAYSYPWDLNGDEAAPDRLVELGVDAVVLAAAYHSVRAATPRHPDHRVVTAESAALYVPVRPEVWAGRDLAPSCASPWAGEDSFNRAASALRAVGLPVRAWVVLTHSTVVGLANPWACVRNAFGDVYSHALCPGNAAVREYARTLAGEVVRGSGVTEIVLEACGPMGVSHLGHHEKTAGADWSDTDLALLSICFCAACTTSLTAAGVDVEHAAGTVRSGTFWDTPEAEVVLQVRSAATRALREAVISEARAAGVTEIAMHAVADPWATGPAVAMTGPVAEVDTCIAPAWEPTEVGADRVRAIHGLTPRLAAYVTALPPVPPDADVLAKHWQNLVDAGADELHLYHAGLASDRRLDAMRTAIHETLQKAGR